MSFERDRRDMGDMNDFQGGGDYDDRGGSKKYGFGRKRVCRFCADSEFQMDYKNVKTMQTFMSEHGRLLPSRISGNCARHQRQLTTALKRARQLALIGYVSPGA